MSQFEITLILAVLTLMLAIITVILTVPTSLQALTGESVGESLLRIEVWIKSRLLSLRSKLKRSSKVVVGRYEFPWYRSEEPLVNRMSELAQMREELEHSIGGSGRILFVAGEPGIGKSRLVAELSIESLSVGATVLWSRCLDSDTGPSFWPWVQLLKQHARSVSAETLRGQMGSAASDIAILAPEIHDIFPDIDPPPSMAPDQARLRLFESITRLFLTAAHDKAMVLVLEDIHWADESSLLLLEALAMEIDRARILLIATYRHEEIDNEHPLIGTIPRINRSQRTELFMEGLSEKHVGQLVAQVVGQAVPESLVAAMYRQTEGNPLFVRELAHEFLDKGGLAITDSSIQVIDRVPLTLRRILLQRLERLSEVCIEILHSASVVGQNFTREQLQHVSNFSREVIIRSLREAIDANIIREEKDTGRFYFVHSLMQTVLYDQMLLDSRAQRHLRIAEFLANASGSADSTTPSTLAYHYYRASRGSSTNSEVFEKAINHLEAAGVYAMSTLGWDEATEHFARALTVMDGTPEVVKPRRCELLISLGEAQMRAGRGAEGRANLVAAAHLAKDVGAPNLLARAALYVDGGVGVDEIDEEVIDLLESSLQTLGDAGGSLRVKVMCKLAVVLYYVPGSLQRRKQLCADVLRLAQGMDRDTKAWAFGAQHRALWGPDNLTQRLEEAAESVKLAEQSEEGLQISWSRAWRFRLLHALLEMGDMAGVQREFEAFARLSSESRQPFDRWAVMQLEAMDALIEGRYDEANRIIRDAFPIGQSAYPTQGPIQHFARHLAIIVREQGQLEEVESHLADLIRRNPQIPHWQCLRAWVLAANGLTESAKSILDRIGESRFDSLSRDGYWLANLAMLTNVSYDLGEVAYADTLYELLTPYASRNITVSANAACLGSVSHHLGLLATLREDWGNAMRHFEAAVKMNKDLGAEPFVAHTQYSCSDMLFRMPQKDLQLALQHLDITDEICDRLSMPLLQGKSQSLRSRIGAHEGSHL